MIHQQAKNKQQTLKNLKKKQTNNTIDMHTNDQCSIKTTQLFVTINMTKFLTKTHTQRREGCTLKCINMIKNDYEEWWRQFNDK